MTGPRIATIALLLGAPAFPGAALAKPPASAPAAPIVPAGRTAQVVQAAPAAPRPALPDPGAPTVEARIQPGTYYVGDPVHLLVTAFARAGVQIDLPAHLDLAPFEVIDTKTRSRPTGDGRVEYEYTLTVAAYQTGDLAVPALSITYLTAAGDTRTVSTRPVHVTIKSLLANANAPQLKPPRPPVAVYERNWTVVIVAGILVGVALVAAASVAMAAAVRRRRLRARPAPPPRPAIEVALEKLAALTAAGDFAREDYKPFYFALSEIVREYLGGRFGFDSLELTTTELLDELGRRADAGAPGDPDSPRAYLADVRRWLGETDLVKFAKVVPTETEARARLAEARNLLEATRPRPAAPADARPAQPEPEAAVHG